MADTFEGFITKYALTVGIQRKRLQSTFSPSMVTEADNILSSYHHGEWHRTWDAALVQAEKMRTAKLASLTKSRAKIEALKFTEPK